MKISTLVYILSALFFLMPAIATAQTDPSSGTVVETINAGSYTYLRLEDPDRWIATSPLDVSEGDKVKYAGGMEMRDFHSKALDRTFESIWFVQNVSVSGRSLEQLHQGVAEGHGSAPPNIPKPATVAAPAPGEIMKLDGGKSIVEITSDPSALEGQAVSLRAKVIKISNNIMGTNWVTLQDGTGTAPNDKLIATTSEIVTAGDIVTAKGMIRTDVDLGSGYLYKVLLEEATFSKSN
jgi:hypothetical protein